MRKINSKFQTKFISEDGGRLINRDYFAYVELDKYACYVLADGLDEDRDAESAKMAVTAVIREFTENPGISGKLMAGYLSTAHKELKEYRSELHLKASIVVVVTDYMKLRYVSAGNSRFYLIRDGVIHAKSVDQSLTAELVTQEKTPKDKAALHEERNNLYCYVGQDSILKPEKSKKIRLVDGDTLLLMSRGVWEYCDEGEMADSLSDAKEPQEVLDNVEELILSKQPEEIDNYTLSVTFADKIYKKPNKKWTAKKILLLVLPIVLIVVIIGVVLLIKHNKKVENIQAMNEYIESSEKYVATDNYQRAKEDYSEAYKLAKKLKLSVKKEEIDKNQKLIEQILLGDQTIKDKDYKGALAVYLLAEQMSGETGNKGKDYIREQLEKTRDYIDVLDYLAEGDKKLDYQDTKGAREAYKKAKDLANENFYQEGKQEAIDKIDKIDQEAAADEAEKKAEKEKEQAEKEKEKAEKKEEEEKEKAEKEEDAAKKEAEEEEKAADKEKRQADQLNALGIEQKGNAAYETGNYEDAKMYYLTSQELYNQLGLKEKSNLVEKKIQLTEKNGTQKLKEKSKGDTYVTDGDKLAKAKEYDTARLMYLLARDVYENAGYIEEAEKIVEKIAAIDKIQEAVENQQ